MLLVEQQCSSTFFDILLASRTTNVSTTTGFCDHRSLQPVSRPLTRYSRIHARDAPSTCILFPACRHIFGLFSPLRLWYTTHLVGGFFTFFEIGPGCGVMESQRAIILGTGNRSNNGGGIGTGTGFLTSWISNLVFSPCCCCCSSGQ